MKSEFLQLSKKVIYYTMIASLVAFTAVPAPYVLLPLKTTEAHKTGPELNFAAQPISDTEIRLSWKSTSTDDAGQSLKNHNLTIWYCEGIDCDPDPTVNGIVLFEHESQKDGSFLEGNPNLESGTVNDGTYLHAGLTTGQTYGYMIQEKHGGHTVEELAVNIIAGSPTQHTLTVDVVGNGTVTSDPAGIDCGSDCTEDYNENTSVELTAVAASGWTFDGWSGDCSGTASTCSVTMDNTRNVTATFTEDSTPPISGGGGGTVTLLIFEETLLIVNISETSATVTWTTNLPATSQVVYAAQGESYSFDLNATNYGYPHSQPNPANSNKVTSHSVTLTGLLPGTNYFLRAVSTASPGTVSAEHSFTTLAVTEEQEEQESATQEETTGDVGPVFTPVVFTPDTGDTTGDTGIETLEGVDQETDEADEGEVLGDILGEAAAAGTGEGSGNFWQNLWWLLILLALLLILFLAWKRRKDKEQRSSGPSNPVINQ